MTSANTVGATWATRTLLRGATVVDGTGAPAVAADVVISGDLIDAVEPEGSVSASTVDEVIDLDGLVLTPGFIDPHTHLDAQLLWDPDLTPSSWHGITTVIIGNCGFGIAPTRPEHRDTVVRTLENVEGMSAEALHAGLRWDFESFPEYLDAVAASHPRLNVAAMLGHTPLRLFVMGEAAVEREAEPDELQRMADLTRAAMAAGAVGFATSRSANHQGAYGRPVPSRLASMDEVITLARAANEGGRRIVQLATGPGLREADELAAFAAAVDAPVTWTALLADRGKSGEAVRRLQATRAANDDLWAQVACRPIVTQTTFRVPTTFGMCPSFAEILGLPESARADAYRNEEWRARARTEADAQWGHRWAETTVQETTAHPELLDGRNMLDVAHAAGVHPLDLMLDLALDENLATRFRIVLLNDDEDEIATLMHDDGALVALSDAGAHASQLCDACYTTDLLGNWVRERAAITLERAVWHLTAHPAELFGLTDRGVIRPGAAADLVALDLGTVGPGPLERVHDLPAGADRLIVRSTGVQHVWVGGVAVRRDGADVDGARPGRLLRA